MVNKTATNEERRTKGRFLKSNKSMRSKNGIKKLEDDEVKRYLES